MIGQCFVFSTRSGIVVIDGCHTRTAVDWRHHTLRCCSRDLLPRRPRPLLPGTSPSYINLNILNHFKMSIYIYLLCRFNISVVLNAEQRSAKRFCCINVRCNRNVRLYSGTFSVCQTKLLFGCSVITDVMQLIPYG